MSALKLLGTSFSFDIRYSYLVPALPVCAIQTLDHFSHFSHFFFVWLPAGPPEAMFDKKFGLHL